MPSDDVDSRWKCTFSVRYVQQSIICRRVMGSGYRRVFRWIFFFEKNDCFYDTIDITCTHMVRRTKPKHRRQGEKRNISHICLCHLIEHIYGYLFLIPPSMAHAIVFDLIVAMSARSMFALFLYTIQIIGNGRGPTKIRNDFFLTIIWYYQFIIIIIIPIRRQTDIIHDVIYWTNGSRNWTFTNDCYILFFFISSFNMKFERSTHSCD